MKMLFQKKMLRKILKKEDKISVFNKRKKKQAEELKKKIWN